MLSYRREQSVFDKIESLQRLVKTCKRCGKLFTAGTTVKQHCSDSCYGQDYGATIHNERVNQRNRAAVAVEYKNASPKCVICAAAIPFESFYKHRKTQVCSSRCKNKRDYRNTNKSNRNVSCSESKKKWERESRSKYIARRYATDPDFKIKKLLRNRLWDALKASGAKKSKSALKLVGCTIPFLKDYLAEKFDSKMSWDNYGDWHIDHIIPCNQFDLKLEQEQQRCFHYTNLQPLWAAENFSKGAKFESGQPQLIV